MKATPIQIQTAVTLLNAVELARQIVTKCAGGDISNHLDGENIQTSDVLTDVIASKVNAELTGK